MRGPLLCWGSTLFAGACSGFRIQRLVGSSAAVHQQLVDGPGIYERAVIYAAQSLRHRSQLRFCLWNKDCSSRLAGIVILSIQLSIHQSGLV
jgi:hypothetical protein